MRRKILLNQLTPIPRTDIMFNIWEEPDKKVNWIKDNFSYTKIEYQYISDDGNIEINENLKVVLFKEKDNLFR